MIDEAYKQPHAAWADVYRFWNLVCALFVREVKGRYRRSLFGVFWAVLPPIFYTGMFVFIQGILKIASEDMPYVVFAYSAMVPWMFVSSAIGRCGSSLVSNAGIIKKMAMAREVFPVTSVLTALLDTTISFALLFALLFWFNTPFGWSLLWLPVLITLGAALALGVGMLVAALGTFKHDVLFAVPLMMQLWLLVSPVMYPLGQVPPAWHSLYVLNPMVGIIEGIRAIMVKGVAPDFALLGAAAMGTATLLLLAWPLFRRLSQNIADVL